MTHCLHRCPPPSLPAQQQAGGGAGAGGGGAGGHSIAAETVAALVKLVGRLPECNRCATTGGEMVGWIIPRTDCDSPTFLQCCDAGIFPRTRSWIVRRPASLCADEWSNWLAGGRRRLLHHLCAFLRAVDPLASKMVPENLAIVRESQRPAQLTTQHTPRPTDSQHAPPN
jgi:hypothetical protein